MIYLQNGRVMYDSRTPWCDCRKKGFGYTRRDDGVWVRPCCMRREHAAWERHGDSPVPPSTVHSVNQKEGTS